MHIVDPIPWLEQEYQRQLDELLARLGEPKTRADRLQLSLEKRKLRRKIFGQLPPGGTAQW